MKELTPREIVKELDRYIIRQDEAKNTLPLPLETATAEAACLKKCGKKYTLKTYS